MRVEVLIERVVLRGVAVRSRRQLMAALEGELTEMLQRDGLPPETLRRHSHVGRLRSRPVQLAHGAGQDATMGRAIGRRVYQTLAAGTPDGPKPGRVKE